MNELIKVNYDSERPTVSARDLHEFLEVATDYRHWFPRMCEYGFTESIDYTPVIFDHPQNGQPTKDYQLTIEMAKEIYRKAGYETVSLSENRQLQKIIAAGLEKTNGLFENLTKTTANTASRQFENALDRAYMQVVSGAFDYNTAVRTAIKNLAQKGIASITYPGGHTDYLDVAVRRAVLTGVSQTTGKMQEQMADDVGCDLVETTAHNGARPDHAQWQGKVFSRSGTSKKYPDFKSSTGYGTGAGLKGWNCRHDFFPYFEDM